MVGILKDNLLFLNKKLRSEVPTAKFKICYKMLSKDRTTETISSDSAFFESHNKKGNALSNSINQISSRDCINKCKSFLHFATR